VKVEMLPAEVAALEGAPAAAVDPTGPLVLVNPRCDVDRLIAYVTPLLPDVDPVEVSAALRAAIRAYEVEALEVDFAVAAAGHPCEVTGPILRPVAAGYAAPPPSWAFEEMLDRTQPVRKIVDPGITADDVPPFPPGRPPRRSVPYHWVLLSAAIGLFALSGFLIGNNPTGPVQTPPEFHPTVPATPAPPAEIHGTKVVDQSADNPARPVPGDPTATPTVPPTPSASASAPVPGTLPTSASPAPSPPASSPSPSPSPSGPGTDPGTGDPGTGTDPGGAGNDPGDGDPSTSPSASPTTDPPPADTGGNGPTS
jgi:hypothetical protein